MSTHPIIIIGAGPAGLMAAQTLATAGFKVVIYDHNKAPARKFLVAGNGGFNLTHSEHIATFVQRYDAQQLHQIVRAFDNQQTILWLKDLGIDTFVGSSGKVFPTTDIKPIQVLQAWLQKLSSLGVSIYTGHKLIDFNKSEVSMLYNGETIKYPYSQLLLAMGGGSWKTTGADASWVSILQSKGIAIKPLTPANSGYHTQKDLSHLEGQVLKNIAVSFQNISKSGELVFTKYGLEGSVIYYLNRFTRHYPFPFELKIDLKPHLSEEQIVSVLEKASNYSKVLKGVLKLSSTAIQLIKTLEKSIYTHPASLAKHIKSFPITVTQFRPIEEVISTAGGVDFSDLNDDLSLKAYPNVYCIGEMVDWEAPTGGYLLQACFSMGVWAGKAIISKSSTTTAS